MRRKQSRAFLLKGILAFCLLFNYLSGFTPIVNATLNGDSNGWGVEVIAPIQADNQENTLDNNQSITSPVQEYFSDEQGTNYSMDDNPSLDTEEENGQHNSGENMVESEGVNVDQIPIKDTIETPDTSEEELTTEISEPTLEDNLEMRSESQTRSAGSGLIQLWQIVPEGQTQEGKKTSEIMKALQCRPNHNLYPLNGSTQHETYVNSCYVDDALYLGEDTNYYHIYLSGYEGKVPKSKTHTFSLDLNGDGKYVDYKIQTVAYYVPAGSTARSSVEAQSNLNVPELNYYDQYLDKYNDSNAKSIELYSTATVQSPSYYANESGTLFHYLTSNVKVAGKYSKVTVGKAPSWMSSGVKYYSYDGVYFYTNWQNIRTDGTGAVNQSNPFYNYYQYLPFRSKSNYVSNTFDTYTNANGGAGGKLVNTGQYFYAVQDKYGINGALQYAMGIHESGWGKSSLSINKNNLFGMNATDNNPYGNGTSFPTVEAGINYHADRYLSWGYTDPLDDDRYFGSHVGNKGSGINVKYASDPFWGEKIAGWYYKFDQVNGMKDYNYYSIGIKQSNVVANIRSKATNNSTLLYQTKNKPLNYKIKNYPVLIIGEEGSYYKIKSDTPVVNNKPLYSGKYQWDNTDVYITKEVIHYLNHTFYRSPKASYNEENIGWREVDGVFYYYIKPDKYIVGWQEIDGNHYYFNDKGHMLTGWQEIDGNRYYFNDKGHMSIGWQEIDGNRYYFNDKGHMSIGWQDIDGNRYYFNDKGHMSIGFHEINGIWYHFNWQGHLQKGWQEISGIWYYFNDKGHMLTGWQDIDGNRYYFNDKGHMSIGFHEINGIWYHFNWQGHLQKGWQEISGIWYYFNDKGHMSIGWQDIDGNRYYFNDKGHMSIGFHEINGIWYHFNWQGHLQKGWQEISGIWYYFNDKGHMLTGWQDIDANRYYFNDKGHMLTGWQDIDANRYYFNDKGHMLTGWQDIDANRYYFNDKGHMLTGWQDIDANRYYFNDKGHMLTGWQDIDANRYYFNDKGHMLTGWQDINGNRYHFNSQGHLIF